MRDLVSIVLLLAAAFLCFEIAGATWSSNAYGQQETITHETDSQTHSLR